MSPVARFAAVLFLVGCASVGPGVLDDTIHRNEIHRAYQQCMQQPAQSPAERRQVCRRWVRVWIAQWEWEKCSNDLERIRECGRRPEWNDVP